MLKINNEPLEIGYFPDKTLLLHIKPREAVEITWHYENNEEFLVLYFVVSHLREHGCKEMTLLMPYIPNARQDRVKIDSDVFTLKYFAEALNSLKFDRVIVLDPHSPKSNELINNLQEADVMKIIDRFVDTIGVDVLFYPDKGSAERYGEFFINSPKFCNIPYVYGTKNRDWTTGKISSFTIETNVNLEGKKVLIIDDICARGSTAYNSAVQLKELGAEKIYLYVSHCENAIFEGQLINCGLINGIYTTNSIYKSDHPLIKVIDWKKGLTIDQK